MNAGSPSGLEPQRTAGPGSDSAGKRQGRRPLLARIIAVLLTVIAVLYAADLPQHIGWALFTEQYLAMLLALSLTLVFLTLPARRKDSRRVPWWDWIAAALALGSAGYVAVNYPTMVNELVYKPLDGLIISAVLILLTIEAVRRTAGLGLTVIIGLFILYAAFGDILPGPLASSPVMLDRMAIYLAMDTNALLGMPLLVAGVIVLAFILMGQILQASGGADFFIDLALALFGRSRGGAAKISVVSSALFGAVSGSAVANVASTGIITIPLMKRGGYPAHQAAAVESVASTGGQLAPPVMGAAAFLMAEFLQIGYAAVVLAATIPALLYYVSLFVWADLTAGKMKLGAPTDVNAPTPREILKSGWHFPLPFLALGVALFSFNLSPQLAALIATGLLVVFGCAIGYRGKRMRLSALWRGIEDTGYAVLEVIAICAAAGIVIGVLNMTGLAFSLTLQLVGLAGGNVIVLLVIAALVSMVLGMGMPTVGVYVLLAGLIGPALVQAGIDAVSAHLFLLYFGMLSMITPPVALASFTAASIASADFWKTGWQAVRIAWVAYLIPFIVVSEPSLAFQGPLLMTAWYGFGAVVGVVLVTMGLVGFAARPLSAVERALLVIAGVLAVVPIKLFSEHGVAPNLIGFALGAVVYLRARSTRSRSEAAQEGAVAAKQG